MNYITLNNSGKLSNYLLTTVGMAMTAARRRRPPRTIRTNTQTGLSTTIFYMNVIKYQDDLRWLYNFKMVNLFPVFVFNMHFVPARHSHQLSLKTDLIETRLSCDTTPFLSVFCDMHTFLCYVISIDFHELCPVGPTSKIL